MATRTRGRYRTPYQAQSPASTRTSPPTRTPGLYEDFLRRQREAKQAAYADYVAKQQAWYKQQDAQRKAYMARMRKESQPQSRFNRRVVGTVKRGETIDDVAGRLGVKPKDITDTGVQSLAAGQVIDVSAAASRRDAEAYMQNVRNQYVAQQQAIVDEYQAKMAKFSAAGPRAKGAGGARSVWEEQIRRAQANIDRVHSGGPLTERASAQRIQERPLTEAAETPFSQLLRWGATDPMEPQYFPGQSPADVRRAQTPAPTMPADNWSQRLDAAGLTGEDVEPVSRGALTDESMQDMFQRDNYSEVAASMLGGRWITDGNGKRIFIPKDWSTYYASGSDIPGMPQRVIDAMGGKWSQMAINYALETGNPDLLPKSIAAGAARLIVGSPYGYTPEQMAELGYIMDDYGNWLLTEPDYEIPFSPGYGDYAGGGYGGGGGGGGWEPNKNTYAGGRSSQLTGSVAQREATRAQVDSMGYVNWRI